MADNHQDKGPQENPVEKSIIGTVIKKRYEIIEKLGQGGMGAVYSARDTVLDRNVALKTLSWHGSNEVARRFQNEARAAGRLQHANTMSVLDFGQTDDGDLYLVMELLNGQSLADWIEENGAMPPDMVVTMFVLILQGLSHAHEKGIVHRDIKPSNIFLAETEKNTLAPKLVDFGISHLAEDDQKLTKTGNVIGSPHYVSPEQARGTATDARSDIYSIGCTMYQALTGSPPFDSDQAVTITMRHISEPAPTLNERVPQSEFPEELEEIVHKCLEKDPADRYQTAEELRQALKQLRAFSTADSSTNSSNENVFDESPQKSQSPYSIPKIAVGSLILLIVGVALFAIAKSAGVDELMDSEQKPHKKVVADQIIPLSSLESGNDIVENEEELKELPPNVDVLALGKDVCNEKSFAQLSRIHRLKSLDVSGSHLDDRCMKIIGSMSSLMRLHLNDVTGLTHEGIAELTRLPRLGDLKLRNTSVDDSDLATIAKIVKMETLNLNDCKRVTDTGLKSLTALPILNDLHISRTKITDDGLKALVQTHKKPATINNRFLAPPFNILHVGGCNVTDKGLQSIALLPALRSLDISNTPITNQGLRSLSSLHKLTRLDISELPANNSTVTLLTVNCPQIRCLDLHDTKVTGAGIAELNEFKFLQVLDISGLNLGDQAMTAWRSNSIQAVNFARNNFTIPGVVNWMKQAPRLQVVVFDQKRIREFEILANAQNMNPHVLSEKYNRYSAIEPSLEIDDGISGNFQ